MRRLALVVCSVGALRRNPGAGLATWGGETSAASVSPAKEKAWTFPSAGEASASEKGDRVGSVQAKLRELCKGLSSFVDAREVAEKAVEGVSERDDASELEGLLAETAASMASRHPDYGRLAARIEIQRVRRVTKGASFSETAAKLQRKTRILDQRLCDALQENATFRALVDEKCAKEVFEAGLDYFGFKTLERSYLLKGDDDSLRERPSHALMRVALGVHEGWRPEKFQAALRCFELLSTRQYMHASPTLFHAGTRKPHLASCFLMGPTEDSIQGIYESVTRCAAISKAAGGVGFSVSDIRAAGSQIRGTGGVSNGLVPMLRVFDATARYVDQGGGKRPGAFAAYLEPWHADVFDFLELKKNHGKEERRARNLFYALWIPDVFMRRVKEDEKWSLMCPDECPGLTTAHSSDFDELYQKYESQGRYRRQVPARQLWRAILDAQIETGTPYILYKDACNSKSNHGHLGTIQCSNLCCEIVEFANATEVAVCNLASIVLPAFVSSDGGFDLDKLASVVQHAAVALDSAIDIAAYPNPLAERSNKRHRPIGIGVQGLADLFLKLRLPFDSESARQLNKDIFEAIYFAAVRASVDQAKHFGPYDTYQGSPASFGLLQPDLWRRPLDHKTWVTSLDRHRDNPELRALESASRWDWAQLRKDLRKHGLRNSLLVSPMPTASTAQIVGMNECFEPYMSNLYARRVKAGEFVVANRFLVNDLAERGLWDAQVREDLLRYEGSVQSIHRVPSDLKALYKTAWELKQRVLVDLAADRGPYVDQSQSLNAFIATPDYHKLTAFHFYGWSKGLKTGMYYLRTKPAATPTRFTLDPRPPSASDSFPASSSDPGPGTSCQPPLCISCSG